MEKGLIGFALEKTNIENCIQGIGQKIKNMGKEFISTKMEVVMMEPGKIAKEKEKVL